jgi:HK97 family phage major capsid protein
MKLQERLKAWQLKRSEILADRRKLLETAETDGDGRTMTAEEQKQFDDFTAQVGTIEQQIKNIDAELALEATTAVKPVATPAAGERSAPSVIITRQKDDAFKGQSFVRMVKAKALAHLLQSTPGAVAQHLWGKSSPLLVSWIKANEVAAGGSLTGEWGVELVEADTRFTGDFIDFLYAATIFDQLALREIPANVTVNGMDGAAIGYWVKQGKAIPVTAGDFSTVTLSPLKVGALAVVTNELLRDSSPSADLLLRDALVQASSQRVDGTFVSDTGAAANESPAGVFNGITPLGSNGFDLDAVYSDINELLQAFITAKNAGGELNFLMSKALAQSLALMRNELGNKAFPELTRNGGTLEGISVKTGDNISSSVIALVKPSDIYKIGDGGVQVSVSRDASIEMNSVPSQDSLGPTGTAEEVVSMFQTESTAIKIVRSINFAKRRVTAANKNPGVAWIDDAHYGNASSTTD